MVGHDYIILLLVNTCTTYDHWEIILDFGFNKLCLIQESIALTFNLSMEENRNIFDEF